MTAKVQWVLKLGNIKRALNIGSFISPTNYSEMQGHLTSLRFPRRRAEEMLNWSTNFWDNAKQRVSVPVFMRVVYQNFETNMLG